MATNSVARFMDEFPEPVTAFIQTTDTDIITKAKETTLKQVFRQ